MRGEHVVTPAEVGAGPDVGSALVLVAPEHEPRTPVAHAIEPVERAPGVVEGVRDDAMERRPDAHALRDDGVVIQFGRQLGIDLEDLEQLLALAEAGGLDDKRVLEEQAERLLADPRAETLVTEFAPTAEQTQDQAATAQGVAYLISVSNADDTRIYSMIAGCNADWH